MVAILDPPREEAVEAIKVAHKAGITVKMITGVTDCLTVCDWAACWGCVLGLRGERGSRGGARHLQLNTPTFYSPHTHTHPIAGDHSLTALAIGRMLGIAGNGLVFTGGFGFVLSR
jgi:hypothetical protein